MTGRSGTAKRGSGLTAARFLLAYGWTLDKRRLVRAALLMLAGFASAPLSSLALAHFVNDSLARRASGALYAALLAAAFLVARQLGSHIAYMDYFELAERQQGGLRVELMDLVNGPTGIGHLDDPGFADNLELVSNGLFETTNALQAVLLFGGMLVQIVLTVVLLVHVDPWTGFLPLFAAFPLLASGRATKIVELAKERTAQQARLNRHFIELATAVASAKELRLFGAEGAVADRQRRGWDELTDQMWRATARGSLLRAAGQLGFAAGYAGAILLVAAQAHAGHTSLGNLVLVISLAVQLSGNVGGAIANLGLIMTAGRTFERVERLRRSSPPPRDSSTPGPDAATAPRTGPRAGTAAVRAPAGLLKGITLEDVSFSYPGATRPAIADLSLHIPAGSTLALVGENGAGKSTLVKLLCGLYTPSKGRILLDGVDMAEVDMGAWRTRVATLFQDFSRIELTLRESIGLGEVRHIADDDAVLRATTAARAEGVRRSVPGGLDGYVGRSYGDGVDLSGGQWQLVGLARCLMRERPLLLVLDEPAASLDAAAEHALFERYATSAEMAAGAQGGITVLVSHRFSTVLMAGTIAVLQQGRLLERGSHRELMAHGGLYAELVGLQARAYSP